MSLSAAMNSALSGLGAASRSAQVVSSNISNALTPGYAVRETNLATQVTGGVRVEGVGRAVDPALLAESRLVGAEAAEAGTRRQALDRLSKLMGDIGSSASLSGRMGQLDAQLIEAAGDPASVTRLTSVATTAGEIATFLNRASDGVQQIRREADRDIATQVEALNQGLQRIDKLNRDILKTSARGEDTNGLKDMRQREIDVIASIVPLREIARPNGGVGLMTPNGQMLLNEQPAVIGFMPSAAMPLGAAAASTLTVDGRVVDMSRPDGPMSGGTLSGAFSVRDDLAPGLQAKLDGFTRDLIERFDDVPGLSVPGQPGLFTDDGAAFAAGNEAGISARISLNTLVDPHGAGEVWRLRDGLGVAGAGAQGDATILQSMRSALDLTAPAGSAALGNSALTLGGQADSVMSFVGGQLFRAEQSETFATSRSAELTQKTLANGVDTDAELQNMLMIERMYGANTKIIQAADAMLQRLLEI